jgi:aspartate racemase
MLWSPMTEPHTMKQTKTMGLVGGLGPEATHFYYDNLLAQCRARGLTPSLLISHANLDLVLEGARNNNLMQMARHLSEKLHQLRDAGAEIFGISAVTPHICRTELQHLTSVPIIDIVDMLNDQLKRENIGSIALMGHAAVVRSRLFGRAAVEVRDPRDDEVQRIHDAYLELTRVGRSAVTTAGTLANLAADLSARLKVDAIVLAGTDLSIISAETWGDVKVIDCAKVHIAGIIDAASA